MTLRNEAVREEAAGEEPENGPQAQTHAQRAISITSALPTALPQGDPESLGDAPELVREWLQLRLIPAGTWLRARAAAVAERELDLIHGPPPTVARLHARHARAAAHWNGAIPKGIRLSWGLAHTALATLLYTVLDVLFSPAGAILAAVFIAICVIWL